MRILWRPAEGSPEATWAEVARARGVAAVRDELESWQGPRLRHGDLVLADGGRQERIYVYDEAQGALVRAPDAHARLGRRSASLPIRAWVDMWEGPDADPAEMINGCDAVDKRRVVLAAVDLARTIPLVFYGDTGAQTAVDVTERWARGQASVADLNRAADGAYACVRQWTSSGHRTAAEAASLAGAVTQVAFGRAVSGATAVVAALRQDLLGHGMRERDADVWMRLKAGVVRHHVPLSVVLCARLGLKDPLPLASSLAEDPAADVGRARQP